MAEDPTLILDMCGGSPNFLMRCPGITHGDLEKGYKCKQIDVISVDGKKFGIKKSHKKSYMKQMRKEGHVVTELEAS